MLRRCPLRRHDGRRRRLAAVVGEIRRSARGSEIKREKAGTWFAGCANSFAGPKPLCGFCIPVIVLPLGFSVKCRKVRRVPDAGHVRLGFQHISKPYDVGLRCLDDERADARARRERTFRIDDFVSPSQDEEIKGDEDAVGRGSGINDKAEFCQRTHLLSVAFLL